MNVNFVFGGQFRPAKGGQFKLVRGGQFHRFLQAIMDAYKSLEIGCIDHADLFNNIGYNLSKEGRYVDAIIFFNYAIFLDPSVSYYYTNRGRCKMLMQPSDFVGACMDYEIAVSLDDSIQNSEVDSLCSEIF